VGLVAVERGADAQVGSANVPLPNVMLLLDTSGSFEHMIDGSNPEDTTAGPFNTNPTGNNDSVHHLYANCETAANAPGGPYPALPNRWGIAVQALTGTFLNAQGSAPFYSCVTMDRASGIVPTLPSGQPAVGTIPLTGPNGLDIEYGIRDESGHYFYPYDSGYYLPFHRPATTTATNGLCVYSPHVLPGATVGGVSIAGGAPAVGDCANEAGGFCWANDFPSDAIGPYLYDSIPQAGQITRNGAPLPGVLTTPNLGYSSNATSCQFPQGSDGILDQASTLVRFGLMTFDNDPSPAIGVQGSAPVIPMQLGTVPLGLASTTPTPGTVGGKQGPFSGMWSYDPSWVGTGAVPGVCTATPPGPYTSPSSGFPANCSTPSWYELGAKNPAAPPWEGRLIGFPNPNADVTAVGQSNQQIQNAIHALRPFGATPTAALMADAEYYFWGDPTGPSTANPNNDPYVAGGCRSQYIILLTDGAPNQDMRTACQGAGAQGSVAGGLCPFQLPEDTASVMATGNADMQTGLPPRGKVYTYVLGFAVSGNVSGLDTGSANCAALAAANMLTGMCNITNGPYSPTDSSNAAITPLPQQQNASTGAVLESPCCSLERIAVAGGTQHAYFADTPGDLEGALAAIIGDITGQLGSRTIPVPSPGVSYESGQPLTASYASTFQAATCSSPDPANPGSCLVPWQSNGPWTGDVQRQSYACGAGGAAALPSSVPLAPDDFAADLASQPQRNFLFFNGWNSATNVSTNALTLRPYLATHQILSASAAPTPPPPDNLDTFTLNNQTGQEFSNFNGINGGPVMPLYGDFAPPGIDTSLGIQPTSCQDPATGQYLDTVSCANLALSFALAQSTFTAGGTPADTNVAAAYAAPVGLLPAMNRSKTPLGAILDSTPAVVGPPASEVRDDSYLTFSTALAPATLNAAHLPNRDTMLYVATIDGLLHAFDTGAGINPLILSSQVEAWSFIPPAVLPHLISNYPGANEVLLDGAPVVKDVVFSRCEVAGPACGTPPSSKWPQEWHTMLVAGFGLGGRGYYAMDVTDPRPPSSAATLTQANFGNPNFPTYVTPGNPPVLHGTGPHFQWQITSMNFTGTTTLPTGFVPNEIFGKISGTPAIATVFADPTYQPAANAAPQEIGVAILPGGRDGLPTPGVACPRELITNPGSYTSGMQLWQTAGQATAVSLPGPSAFNVTDPAYPPRGFVRSWAQNCGNVAGQRNSAVAGRSVMIVSVATGQILAVFARAPSQTFLSTNDPSTWDVPTDGLGHTLIGTGATDGSNPYINFTPLDSPMTGRPVVYPSGVGVVAQAVYIGDADGTIWRFDLSDQNPHNWTGAIFADAYSPNADQGGGDSYSPTANATSDWNAFDSQPITIEPQIALNTKAAITMNFATGDQTAFNVCYEGPQGGSGNHNTSPACTGALQPTVSFLYSVQETRNVAGGPGTPPYQAKVNWYNGWTTGERVTGPMAIFNGALYFATYIPEGVGNSTGCANSGPSLYAWDFSNVNLTCGGAHPLSCGGDPNVDPNFAPTGQLNYTAIAVGNPSVTRNTVIPGVSIATTPSCATTGAAPGGDAVSGGAHTTITNPSPPTYSLVANIGKGKNSTAQNLITQKLATPASPTVVDSWAMVSE
jgi:type IV pilus assembly protein PilY1